VPLFACTTPEDRFLHRELVMDSLRIAAMDLLKFLPLVSIGCGFMAAIFWGWSAMVRRPPFRLLDTFIAPDHTGDIPANRYFRRISRLNAAGAGFASVSMLCALVYTILLTVPV
jgi:hypothetical protein